MAKGFYYVAVSPDTEEREIARADTVPELAMKLDISVNTVRYRLRGISVNDMASLERLPQSMRSRVTFFVRERERTPETLAPAEPDPPPKVEPVTTSPITMVVRELQPITKGSAIGYAFRVCGACRARVSKGDRFCRMCGRALKEGERR